MKVAVLGSGGVGGFLGGALAKAGNDVWFIARGDHLRAMREKGLTIQSAALGNFHLKVKATDDPSEIERVDLVLFCVKSYDTEEALKSINPLIGESTVVLSLQNGVDNEDKIANAIGVQHVLAGVLGVESYISEPGIVRQTVGPWNVTVGELSGEVTSRVEDIRAAFMKAGLKCGVSNRIRDDLWNKFVYICGTAGVCCVARASIREVADFEPTRNLYLAVMQEVEAIAKRQGINVTVDIREKVSWGQKVDKAVKPSMLRDLERGKRLEVDAFSGTVAKLGRQLAIPTPANDFIYACLKIHDNKATANQRPNAI